MRKFLTVLLIFSFLFPQEPCDGECYTDEEARNIEVYITELEQKNTSNSLIIKNLEEQLQLYLQQTNIDSTIIENYIEQLKLKEDYIKEVIKSDFAEPGDEDVFRKIKSDFQKSSVTIEDSEIMDTGRYFLQISK